MGKIHKHISFDKDFLSKLEKDTTACVGIHKQLYHLALHPFHLADLNSSIKGLLDEKIAKYDKKFDGILLGYKNIELLNNTGGINFDSCFIHINIKADFYIFKPTVGQILNGVVNKRSKDHVGCLVHKTFNVSLPKPEECEDWIGHSAQLGQEIQFEIIFTNLDGKLPYIKGKILSLLSDDSGFSTSEEPNTIDCRQNIVTKFSEVDDVSETVKPHKKHKHKEKSNKHAYELLQENEMNNVDDQGNSIIIKPAKKSKKHENEMEASTSKTIFDDDLDRLKKSKKHKRMKDTKPKELVNESDSNDNSFEEIHSKEKKNKDICEVLQESKVSDNVDEQGNNMTSKSSRRLKKYGSEVKKIKKHKHIRDTKPEVINESDFINNVFKAGKVEKKNNFESLQENEISDSLNDQGNTTIIKPLRNLKDHEMENSISNIIIDDVQVKRKKKHKMNEAKLNFQNEQFERQKKSSKHKHSIQVAMDVSVNNLPLDNDNKISKRKKSKSLSFDNDASAQQGEYYDFIGEIVKDSEDKVRIHVKKRKKEK